VAAPLSDVEVQPAPVGSASSRPEAELVRSISDGGRPSAHARVALGINERTLHVDDEVLVTAADGTIEPHRDHGYLVADTRLVSGWKLRIGSREPILLASSSVEPYSARFELTNPALETPSGALPASTLHLRVDRTLGGGVHEDLELTNYAGRPVVIDVEVRMESDFADLFDLRRRSLVHRGTLHGTWEAAGQRLRTEYRNDGFTRALEVRVETNGAPVEYANGSLIFPVRLEPGVTWHACVRWVPFAPSERTPTRPCHALLGQGPVRTEQREEFRADATYLSTGNPHLDRLLGQAVADLSSLRLGHEGAGGTRNGPDEPRWWVPAAGVPWFVALFGRDSLVVSLQTLLLSPRFATASLEALAAFQATTFDAARDAEPGKIPHELRRGELASLGLIPHTPYYGTHDATTLFVKTAAELWRWVGDRDLLARLRGAIERALGWIDHEGDRDGDGLQEYQTRSPQGYRHQGWKDAEDAIVHADGSDPEGPIALVELQGYVVDAKRSWAKVLEEAFDEGREARRLRAEADRLAELVEERFWWEAEGTYYLGLNGTKRPIATVASNAAHLLWSGCSTAEHAASVARRLLQPDCFSGWGIRTLSADHPSYNPFSYQRGSVWPHDNVIAAAGFRRFGLDEACLRVASAIVDAAGCFAGGHLPELFAGLARDPGAFPVPYQGANVPQAWAAGALVHLVEILLGLEADAPRDRLLLRPAIPAWVGSVRLENLRIGAAALDLRVERLAGGRHEVHVAHRRGSVVVEIDDTAVETGTPDGVPSRVQPDGLSAR
jgi:glycogen debranching enzyme